MGGLFIHTRVICYNEHSIVTIHEYLVFVIIKIPLSQSIVEGQMMQTKTKEGQIFHY